LRRKREEGLLVVHPELMARHEQEGSPLFWQGSGTLSAVASWAIGDTTLADLVTKAPVIFGGLGLAALGVKVDAAKSQAAKAKAK
jgi:hypothetical protein